jgi:hypothetical protein
VEQHRHVKEYTTPDFRALGILSLKEKKVESRLVAERQILYQDVGKQHDKDG